MTLADPLSTAALSIRFAKEYVCAPDWFIPAHVCGYNAFLLVRSGEGWVEYDGRRLSASAGDLFITRTWRQVAAGHDPQLPFTLLSIGFTMVASLSIDALRLIDLPERLRLPPAEEAAIDTAMRRVCMSHAGEQAVDRIESNGRLLLLMADIIRLSRELSAVRCEGSSGGAPCEDARITAVRQWIDQHLPEEMGLDDLAAVAHLSRSHFIRLFRQHTRMSPVAYVCRRRMEVAQHMLAYGSQPVSEIAAAVGYPDPLHFSRAFRREAGMSPTAYRKSFSGP